MAEYQPRLIPLNEREKTVRLFRLAQKRLGLRTALSVDLEHPHLRRMAGDNRSKEKLIADTQENIRAINDEMIELQGHTDYGWP